IPGPWSTTFRGVAMTDGALYVAAWSGLYKKTGENVDYLAKPAQILSRNLSCLAVDPAGRLYVGSRGGIDIYRGGRRERIVTGREGLPSTDVRCMNFDKSGTLWVGTSMGVARYNGKGWSLRHSLRWLPNDEVRDVAFSSDGTAWIATKDGVGVLKQRKMTL